MTFLGLEINSSDSAISDTANWLSTHGVRILIIILAAYILKKIGTKLIVSVVEKTARRDLFPTETDRKRRVRTLESLVGTSLRVGLWLIAATLIVDEMGVNTAPLLASAGVLGVALGFGAQSLIKDFVSGIFIIVENQYRVGDIVRLNDISGKVEAITVRTTVLRDLNGHLHHIPNGSIDIATNETMDFGQINENIVVGFDTNMDELEHVIKKVGEQLASSVKWGRYIKDPPHMATLKGFGENGMVIKILGRTDPNEKWKIESEMYKLLKKSFDEHGIEIPYQHVVSVNEKKK